MGTRDVKQHKREEGRKPRKRMRQCLIGRAYKSKDKKSEKIDQRKKVPTGAESIAAGDDG